MKEVVLITGENGNLAKTLKKLLANSYEIRTLTTINRIANNINIFIWDINKNYIDKRALSKCKHIIHLSGSSILNRWNSKNKKKMYQSRIGGAELIFKTCQELKIKPKTFISASAMGIYGLDATGIKNEKSPIGNDWISQMANDWELSADKFNEIGSRVIQMRISLLISKNSGFLKYNLLSMKFGVGVIIGSKNNPVNWIHIKDVALFIKNAIIDDNYSGRYNLSNKENISQKDFMRLIKKMMFPYAMIITIPIWIMQIFLGKRSKILNNKMMLDVTKLREVGFNHSYNTLEEVIKD